MLGNNKFWKLFSISIFVIYTLLLIANFMGLDMPTPFMIFVFVVMSPFALIGMVGTVFETISFLKSKRQAQ